MNVLSYFSFKPWHAALLLGVFITVLKCSMYAALVIFVPLKSGVQVLLIIIGSSRSMLSRISPSFAHQLPPESLLAGDAGNLAGTICFQNMCSTIIFHLRSFSWICLGLNLSPQPNLSCRVVVRQNREGRRDIHVTLSSLE